MIMEYEIVIGLEVHVQLKTRSKLFCGCSTAFGKPPNTNVCPVCSGMPGVLPVLNKRAVELALKTALALGCDIPPASIFARKNYFYPDLPKDYQISQYEHPLAENGFFKIETPSGKKQINLVRAHLEEDAGKLLHEIGSQQIDGSLVDFNRCGVPLLEIVSCPDIRSPQEAAVYLRTLKELLQYLEVSDCDMEKGSLRCDANISVRKKGSQLGVKTEIKNMNSFKGVEKALTYEADRQIKALAEGEKIIQETRLYDSQRGITSSMRGKEESHDYRYFPEPDLVPLRIDAAWINQLKATLPEFPAVRKKRFTREYNLSEYDAGVLTSQKALADYYESGAKILPSDLAKPFANWVMGELLGHLNAAGKSIAQTPVPASHLAKLVLLIDRGTISGKIAKTVFEEMFVTGGDPQTIIKEKGLVQIVDEAEICKVIELVLKDNPASVEDYKKGKKKALGFLVGQVMKQTQGKANPSLVNKLLVSLLEK